MELSEESLTYYYLNNLRKFREMAGFTQIEAAKRIGLTGSTRISLWERGLALPSSENLFRLSILYGRLPDDLYSGFKEMLKSDMERLRLACEG